MNDTSLFCRYCKARSGEPCKTATGKLAAKVHKDRLPKVFTDPKARGLIVIDTKVVLRCSSCGVTEDEAPHHVAFVRERGLCVV